MTKPQSTFLEIQDRLFTIGSSLACDPIKEPQMRIPDLKEADIVLLEKEMDRISDISCHEIFYIARRTSYLYHICILPDASAAAQKDAVYGWNWKAWKWSPDFKIPEPLKRLSVYTFPLYRLIN